MGRLNIFYFSDTGKVKDASFSSFSKKKLDLCWQLCQSIDTLQQILFQSGTSTWHLLPLPVRSASPVSSWISNRLIVSKSTTIIINIQLWY